MALKILLADDSQHAQRDGSRILTELGYEVITVGNGTAALERLEEAQFDLVIADTSMPGLTGLEVCERIRQRPEWANMPVLLALAAFELFDAGLGRQAGADDVIQKPFIPSALERAVQQLLSRAGKLAAEPAGGPTEAAAEKGNAAAEVVGNEPATVSEPVAGGPSGGESGPPSSVEMTEPGTMAAEPPRAPLVLAAAATVIAETGSNTPGAASAGHPRWELAALEVVSSETPVGNSAVPAPLETPAAQDTPGSAAETEAPRTRRGEPGVALPGTWLAQKAEAVAATPATAEPEDVLLSAWREAMAAPAEAPTQQVSLANALNAVDEVLAQYLAPMMAGEASEQVARRLRALAR